MPAKDIAGYRYGRLTVIERVANDSRGNARWDCECDCGNVVEVRATNLRSGNTKSCGCLNAELSAERYVTIGQQTATHGMSTSREYRTWDCMKQRCTNPKAENYQNYGGRGITVCDRWLNSFENFYADMGPRPEGHSIDRIDVNGNYEPDNCRWATAKQQANNRRPQACQSTEQS